MAEARFKTIIGVHWNGQNYLWSTTVRQVEPLGLSIRVLGEAETYMDARFKAGEVLADIRQACGNPELVEGPEVEANGSPTSREADQAAASR